MIEFADVTVSVPRPQGTRTLLRGIALQLTEQRIAVIGPNGSGKSTLLRLMNGLIAPTQGHVTVDGLDTVRDGRKVRGLVGFVFTDPATQLVMATPLDDVELSLRKRVPNKDERRATAMRLLAEHGLADLAEQSVFDLSGGERQLVALASVLAVEPSVIVADEPTTLLDLRNRNLVRQRLGVLPHQVIVATHDLELAADAERVLLIEDGRVSADGAPAEVIAHYRATV